MSTLPDDVLERWWAGCVLCGGGEPTSRTVFHHVYPESKIAGVGEMGNPENVRDEADKCVVVCYHCHGLIHSKKLSDYIPESVDRGYLLTLRYAVHGDEDS